MSSIYNKKTPLIQRIFYGFITGAFMFGAYFFLDMGFYSLYGDRSFIENNTLFFIMLSFLIGVVTAQFYIWFYKRGFRTRR